MPLITEPKTFIDAIAPLNYLNWAIGIGLLHPPRSLLFRSLMSLYSVCFPLTYAVVIYFAFAGSVDEFFADSSPLASAMYRVLCHTNATVALLVPFISWSRRQGLRNSIKRIEKLNDNLAMFFGVKNNYRMTVIRQIYYILTITVLIATIIIVDSTWVQGDSSLLTFNAVYHHPIMLMLVTDTTFCAFVGYLHRKFRALNTALIGLAESRSVSSIVRKKLILVGERRTGDDSAVDEINVKIDAGNSNREFQLLRIVRKFHLELSAEAGELNAIFGVQNLLSMGVSFVMVTGLLYVIYSAASWKQNSHDELREIIPCSFWCVTYALKIIVLSHSCERVSYESLRSGKILYEIVGSAGDKEFRKEIQEFALQMIQNPVRFTACGFFALDHTYIQGVIGSITTYLVILIQMSNVSSASSTSIAGTNETR